MSTPLNELQTNIQQNQNDMQQDDSNSQIVTEILKEMSSTNTSQPRDIINDQQQMYINDQENHINRQIDPSINMSINDNLRNIDIDNSMPLNIEDTITVSTKSKTETILEKLKDPIAISLIVFLLMSPPVKKLLSSYLPKIFSDGVKPIVVWLSIFIKSLTSGLIFFAFKSVM